MNNCKLCGQKIKPVKPNLEIGQELWACLAWDNNKIQHYEVVFGTNKKSLVTKCFEDDGSFWFSTGFGYKDIGTRLFLTQEEAIKNPV